MKSGGDRSLATTILTTMVGRGCHCLDSADTRPASCRSTASASTRRRLLNNKSEGAWSLLATTILTTMVGARYYFGSSNKGPAPCRPTAAATAVPPAGEDSNVGTTTCLGSPRVAETRKRLVAIWWLALGIIVAQPAGGAERANTALYGGLFDSTSTIAYAEVSWVQYLLLVLT